MAKTLRLGTRGSLLARTQSAKVGRLIAEVTGAEIEEVIIRTEGDDLTKPITSPQRPGVFVSALRDALLENRVDFIVHSFKDLPSLPFAGVALAAVPEREDWRDALISESGLGLMNLPQGAKVGTSSPRRAARLLFARPDLEIAPIRGNIDTRIGKVLSGEYQATVLAVAGLNRIGFKGKVAEVFDTNALLPAPAQGALAIECRSTDTDLLVQLASLNDSLCQLLTTAERAVLVGVNASCTTAIGAFATFESGTLTVTAELSDLETNRHERVSESANLPDDTRVSEAHQLGLFVAAKLMQTQLGKDLAEANLNSGNV